MGLSVIDVDLYGNALVAFPLMLHQQFPGGGEPPEHKYLHRGEVVVVLCAKAGLGNIEYYEVLTRHGIGWLWIFDVKHEIP